MNFKIVVTDFLISPRFYTNEKSFKALLKRLGLRSCFAVELFYDVLNAQCLFSTNEVLVHQTTDTKKNSIEPSLSIQGKKRRGNLIHQGYLGLNF